MLKCWLCSFCPVVPFPYKRSAGVLLPVFNVRSPSLRKDYARLKIKLIVCVLVTGYPLRAASAMSCWPCSGDGMRNRARALGHARAGMEADGRGGKGVTDADIREADVGEFNLQ